MPDHTDGRSFGMFGVGTNAGGQGNSLLSFGAVDAFRDNDAKLYHDRYEVYVNGDFVGYKTLLTTATSDNLRDVEDFLKEQGIVDFSAIVDGDHYNIQTDVNPRRVSDALKVYLNNI